MLETFGQVGIVVMMLATFVVMVMLVSLNDFGLLGKTENEVFRVRMSDYAHTA